MIKLPSKLNHSMTLLLTFLPSRSPDLSLLQVFHFPNSTSSLFSRADQHVGNSWWSGIDIIPSLFTLTHSTAPNSARRAISLELILLSIQQQPGSLFNQKPFSWSQGAAVSCYNPDKRVWESFQASGPSKILRAVRLSLQKCRNSS